MGGKGVAWMLSLLIAFRILCMYVLLAHITNHCTAASCTLMWIVKVQDKLQHFFCKSEMASQSRVVVRSHLSSTCCTVVLRVQQYYRCVVTIMIVTIMIVMSTPWGVTFPWEQLLFIVQTNVDTGLQQSTGDACIISKPPSPLFCLGFEIFFSQNNQAKRI